MKIGVIIKARMTSTRLPGKVMLDLCGKSVLEQEIRRIMQSNHEMSIIIATTTNESDNVIVEFAEKNGLKVFRGSENDVLSRYYYAAVENHLDIIIRITSDCPLYDAKLLDEMLDEFLKEESLDYLSNTFGNRTYPRGLDTEIFNFPALEKAFKMATEQPCREHVTPYIYGNPEIFNVKTYVGDVDYSHLRWTLDTDEDYKLISEIYNYFYLEKKDFGYSEIIKAYQENPSWYHINNNIAQKVIGYKNL